MSSGWLSLPTAALLYLTVLSFQFLVFRNNQEGKTEN